MFHFHKWTKWHVIKVLILVHQKEFNEDRQQRECVTCGFIQVKGIF